MHTHTTHTHSWSNAQVIKIIHNMLGRLNLRVVFIVGDRAEDVSAIIDALRTKGIRVESDSYFDPQQKVVCVCVCVCVSVYVYACVYGYICFVVASR